MTKLRDVITRIHEWIPPETAQSYDNVGLQVGDPDTPISRGLIALDLTPTVVEEAVESGVDLIVTHHPVLFKALKRVDASNFAGSMVHRLAAAGVAVVAAHTNLDAAAGGVSARLAELLGLKDLDFLQPLPSDLVKLVTYVPAEHADAVRTAVARASEQTVGPYSDTAFQSAGAGFFRPLEEADPAIGKPGGDIQRVDELRIEWTLSTKNLGAAISALKETHPYETVVYDVFEIQLPSDERGLGMIGMLGVPTDLSSFLNHVCTNLDVAAVRYVGHPGTSIGRVAVCGGAGRDLISTAMKAGADAYVTSDLSYHNFFEVLDAAGDPRMVLIDAGHYETEAAAEGLLVEWLKTNVPEVEWRRTKVRTSPIAYFIR